MALAALLVVGCQPADPVESPAAERRYTTADVMLPDARLHVCLEDADSVAPPERIGADSVDLSALDTNDLADLVLQLQAAGFERRTDLPARAQARSRCDMELPEGSAHTHSYFKTGAQTGSQTGGQMGGTEAYQPIIHLYTTGSTVVAVERVYGVRPN